MGPPHKVYVPPHPSPPITALSPCTCPPPYGGGTSPLPYHQGLGKTLYDDFGYRHKLLVDRLLSQGYEVKRLKNLFKKFYGRYSDLIRKYQRSVKDMVADSFPDKLHAVVQLVLSPFLILILSLGLSLFIN